MSDERHGGSAFPGFETIDQWDKDDEKYREIVVPTGGMTLRDYFAAKAMQAMCGSENWSDATRGQIAFEAFAQADAMLKAREQ